MEDEVKRLLRATDLLAGVNLMLAKQFGLESDISRLIDAVNVTEGSGNAEVGANLTQGSVDIVDILGLGVQRRVIDASVVNTIFFTAGDTNFHLYPDTKRCHALEVLDTSGDVLFFWLLRKIKHVGRKKGLLVFLVVGFVSSKHAIKPRQKLVGTMVAVKNNGSFSIWLRISLQIQGKVVRLTRRMPSQLCECGGRQ